MFSLNESAWHLCDELAADAQRLNVTVTTSADGTRLIDCGLKAAGGLEAGRRLAEICLAGLGEALRLLTTSLPPSVELGAQPLFGLGVNAPIGFADSRRCL